MGERKVFLNQNQERFHVKEKIGEKREYETAGQEKKEIRGGGGETISFLSPLNV